MKLRYNLDELNGNTNYITLKAGDKYGREVSIVTTKEGGLFYWSDNDYCYHQTQGTAQYKITSESQAKRELKKKYEEYVTSLNDYYYSETTHFNAFNQGTKIKAESMEQAKKIALGERSFKNCYLKLGNRESFTNGLLTKEFWRCEPNSNKWQDVACEEEEDEELTNE